MLTLNSRRTSHDLTYLFIASVMLALAGVYAFGVIDFFEWPRIVKAGHAWAFLALVLSPSAFILAALIPVAADWKRTRPRIWVPMSSVLAQEPRARREARKARLERAARRV